MMRLISVFLIIYSLTSLAEERSSGLIEPTGEAVSVLEQRLSTETKPGTEMDCMDGYFEKELEKYDVSNNK